MQRFDPQELAGQPDSQDQGQPFRRCEGNPMSKVG